MTPLWASLVIAGAFGLCIGSFLNVCIYRLPRGESLVHPRSRCTTCGRTLSWFDNIPVVSWAVQRGRCRTCGQRVSVMYPAVEVVNEDAGGPGAEQVVYSADVTSARQEPLAR